MNQDKQRLFYDRYTKMKEFNKGQIVLAHDYCSTVCEIVKWINGAFLYLVKVGDLTWEDTCGQLKCFEV